MLVQIYLLLSQERMVNLENLSEEFNDAVSDGIICLQCSQLTKLFAAPVLHARPTKPSLRRPETKKGDLCYRRR